MDKKEILRELLEDLDELTDEEFLQLVEILEKSSVPFYIADDDDEDF